MSVKLHSGEGLSRVGPREVSPLAIHRSISRVPGSRLFPDATGSIARVVALSVKDLLVDEKARPHELLSQMEPRPTIKAQFDAEQHVVGKERAVISARMDAWSRASETRHLVHRTDSYDPGLPSVQEREAFAREYVGFLRERLQLSPAQEAQISKLTPDQLDAADAILQLMQFAQPTVGLFGGEQFPDTLAGALKRYLDHPADSAVMSLAERVFGQRVVISHNDLTPWQAARILVDGKGKPTEQARGIAERMGSHNSIVVELNNDGAHIHHDRARYSDEGQYRHDWGNLTLPIEVPRESGVMKVVHTAIRRGRRR